MTNATIAEKLERVNTLDLTSVRRRLTTPFRGQPAQLTPEEADATEVLYRAFLQLHVLHPGVVMPPTAEIDVWLDAHAADTEKFLQDGMHVFGGPIFHNPNFGVGGPEAEALLWEAFDNTRRLWQREFGTELPADAAPDRCYLKVGVPALPADAAPDRCYLKVGVPA